MRRPALVASPMWLVHYTYESTTLRWIRRVSRRAASHAQRDRHQVRRGWPAGGRVVGVGVALGGGRAITLSAILSYNASGISRRSTSSVLALKGRARMMASARTSPMPSRVIRSSRLAVLRSITLAGVWPGTGRVWANAHAIAEANRLAAMMAAKRRDIIDPARYSVAMRSACR